MKYTVRKDKIRRKLFKFNEQSQHFLKTLTHDQSFSHRHRFFISQKWQKVQKYAFLSRVKSYCVLTTRAGGCIKFYSLSRLKFRELANAGHLPGVSRSSW